jgi:ABC-type amino acid transport substrate-binding protein
MSKKGLKNFLFDLRKNVISPKIWVGGKKKITNDDLCLKCKPFYGNYKINPRIAVVVSGYPYAYYDKIQGKYNGLCVNIMHQLVKDLNLTPTITYIGGTKNSKEEIKSETRSESVKGGSSAAHNESKFNKAINLVADGTYDMAIGHFYLTARREALVNFTSPIFLGRAGLLYKSRHNYFGLYKNMIKTWVKPILILFGLAITLGSISYFLKGRYSEEAHHSKWHFWGTLAALLGEPGTVIDEADITNTSSLLLGLVILATSFYLSIYFSAQTTTTAVKYTSDYDPFFDSENGMVGKKILIRKSSERLKQKLKKNGAIPIILKKNESGVDILLKGGKDADGYASDIAYIATDVSERPKLQVNYSKWPETYLGSSGITIPVNRRLTGLLRALNLRILQLQEKGYLEHECSKWLGEIDKNLCKL